VVERSPPLKGGRLQIGMAEIKSGSVADFARNTQSSVNSKCGMAPDMGSPATLMKRINQREGDEAQGAPICLQSFS
jgi:hypothetical protein